MQPAGFYNMVVLAQSLWTWTQLESYLRGADEGFLSLRDSLVIAERDACRCCEGELPPNGNTLQRRGIHRFAPETMAACSPACGAIVLEAKIQAGKEMCERIAQRSRIDDLSARFAVGTQSPGDPRVPCR